MIFIIPLLSFASRDSSESDADDDLASKEEKSYAPKIKGYLQFHYRGSVETNHDGVVDHDNFRVLRVRLGVKGKIKPKISYTIEFDPRAPTIDGVLRDAYISIKKLIPHHQIRLGQQKTQFGYENRESSTRLYEVNRAFASDNLARGVTLRDIGIGVLGKIDLSEDLRIEDALTVTNGSRMNSQDDYTSRKNYWGRIGIRKGDDSNWTRLGTSFGFGDIYDPFVLPAEPQVAFDRYGIDYETDSPNYFVSAEYIMGRDDIKGDQKVEVSGYYLNLVHKMKSNYGPLIRFDVTSKGGSETARRWTGGFFWGELDDECRFLFNYEYRERMDGARADDKYYFWMQAKI